MKEIFQINDRITWIDIISPNALDLRFLKQLAHFHPITLDEITHPSSRSKVQSFDGYFYIVSYLPIYDIEARHSKQEEIDILVTKKEMITIHYIPLEVIEEFKNVIQNEKVKQRTKETFYLLYLLLEKVTDFSLRQLIHIEEKVNIIGEKLFTKEERKLLEEISFVKRDLSFVGLSLDPQRHVLDSLLHVKPKFWEDSINVSMYFSDLVGDYNRVTNLYRRLRESLDDFDKTNSQLLSYKVNEVMKIFTVLAFVVLPLVTLLSLLQINFINDLVVDKPIVIFALFFGSLLLTLLLIKIFKKKKWL